MLTIPPNHFQIFHRHLPTMELLISGTAKDREYMYVKFSSMGNESHIKYKVVLTETIEMAIRNILILTHEKLFQEVGEERQKKQESGWMIH